MSHKISWRPRCVVCEEFVSLEESKADENGRAVHENCYVSMLLSMSASKRPMLLAKTAPKHERLSLMTMLMSAGWN
jgi:hypothetical protein